MEIQFSVATDVGCKRDHNEDNFLLDPQLRLFIVADGMGGHAAGEVASQLAVHHFCRSVRENADLLQRYHQGKVESLTEARHEMLVMLDHAVNQASAEVFKAGRDDPEKRGMGTTLTALLIAGDRAFTVHVGDSRIYLLRQGQIHQITEDHSLVNELVKRGKIRREDFDRSAYAKYRNAMTRAVGAYETVEPEALDFDMLPDDTFLLCSDGLHHYLDDTLLKQYLGDANLPEVSKKLVSLARSGGGHDNITGLVLRISDRAAESSARVSEVNNKVQVLRNLDLFKHLDYKEIIRILNLTEVRDFAPGETILTEGEQGEEMYVILRGKVRLFKASGFTVIVERGAHFGEMALVDRAPRSASAVAEQATRVLTLRRKEFYEIIKKEPRLATKLMWSFVQVLTDRLRRTTADVAGAPRPEVELLEAPFEDEEQQ